MHSVYFDDLSDMDKVITYCKIEAFSMDVEDEKGEQPWMRIW